MKYNRTIIKTAINKLKKNKLYEIDFEIRKKYSLFKNDLKKISDLHKRLASHGTNSYALEGILSDGIKKGGDLNANFSGENVSKPNSKSSVSISVSDHPYYLSMGLYYAERVSKFDVKNREKYFTNYLLNEFIIKTEGGLEKYSEKILIKKGKSTDPKNLLKMKNKLLEDQKQRKNSTIIPKYLFSTTVTETHINALDKISLWLTTGDKLTLKTYLGYKPGYQMNEEYFILDFAKKNEKAIKTENTSLLLEQVKTIRRNLEKDLAEFNLLSVPEREKIFNTYPVVVLFDVTDLETSEVTSKILCERVVKKVPVEKILCVFATENIINEINSKYAFEIMDIEMLYRYETERMKKYHNPNLTND